MSRTHSNASHPAPGRSALVTLIAAVALLAGSAGATGQSPAAGGLPSGGGTGGGVMLPPGHSPTVERVFSACPVSVDEAIAIAGQPLAPYEVYEGAGVFQADTVADITSYTCRYGSPTDPDVSSLVLSLSYTVDGSADRQWDIMERTFPDASAVPIDRYPAAMAWETTLADADGASELARVIRGARSLIQVDVAAYGTGHPMDEVRTMIDAWGDAAVAVLEGP